MKTFKRNGLRKPSLHFRIKRSGKLALVAGLLLSGLSVFAQKAYIPISSGTVKEVDLATNTITNTFQRYNLPPHGIAVSPDGKMVLVTSCRDFETEVGEDPEGSQISYINTATNTTTYGTEYYSQGGRGICITPDGLTAYFADVYHRVVRGIDLGSQQETHSFHPPWQVPGSPTEVVISPDGKKVYSANPDTIAIDFSNGGIFENGGGRTISVYDRTTDATDFIELPGKSHLCVSPDGSRLYASGLGGIAVVNTADNSILSHHPSLAGLLCISPDGGTLYIANGGQVRVVSTANMSVLATIPVTASVYESMKGISITRNGSKVVVVVGSSYPYPSGQSRLYVINTATNTIAATIPVGYGAGAPGNFIGPDPVAPCVENFTTVCHQQGLTHGGGPVPANRSLTSNAETALKSDAQGPVNFYSLGFGGSITLKSSCPVNNGEGNDIKVWETTFGNPPINNYSERGRVFASQDGINFRYLGMATYDGSFDLSSVNFAWAQYFRIVDATTRYAFTMAQEDGYDVDGIEVLNGFVQNVIPSVATNAGAASVCGATQGKTRDFNPVAPIRSNPVKATGLPQSDDSFNFFTLGFGGSICLKFDYAVFDGPGGELQVVETTFGTSTCDQNKERAEVAVSFDGLSWKVLGEYCQDYSGTIDLTASNSGIQYVRVRDVSLRSDFVSAAADGYDLDAVANVSSVACGSVSGRRAVSPLFDQTTVPEDIQGLQIIGNPVNEQINLQFTMVNAQATLTIMDHIGRRISSETVTGTQWELKELTLPAANLPSGVYFVSLDSQVQKETITFLKK